MDKLNKERQQYFELEKHNIFQHILIISMVIFFIILIFYTLLPFIQNSVIGKFMEGESYNQGQYILKEKFLTTDKFIASSDELKKILQETPNKVEQTNYLFSWALNIYHDSPQDARYWFDPILSLLLPISLFSFLLSLIFTSILPKKIGLMSHKIERELINVLDKIHYDIYGFYSNTNNKELIDEILNADSRLLHNYSDKWKVLHEDLKIIQKALKWRNGNFLYRIFHPWAGLGFYLRFYFTEKYGNFILGLVYIGAAVLIIIIGMRGLKFVPSTQPSIIFFALGLEFSVLLTYAFTVMYSRSDSESEQEQSNKSENKHNNFTLDLGSTKEVENLLRAFIRNPKIKNED
jgi:ABC-type multidrug transport system fused ATPase/permease subunit